MARPIDDPYRTLGILRGAEPDEIRAAHRRLAKRFHPDGSMGDEQRFLAVQEAYQLLSDPLRRRDWDHRHAAGPMPAQRGPARPSHDPPHAEPPHAVGPDDRIVRCRSDRLAPRGRNRRPVCAPGRGRPNTSPGGSTSVLVPLATASLPRPSSDRPPDRGRQGRSAGPDEAPAAAPGMDADVFSRSSGAAWSMAARRHFRRAGAEDPPPPARPTTTRHTGARADDGPASPPPSTPEERPRP